MPSIAEPQAFTGTPPVDNHAPPASLHGAAARAQRFGMCGHGALFGYDLKTRTGKIIPLTCKQWACPRCAKAKRRQWVQIVRSGKPERMITLTAPPQNFSSPGDAIRTLNKVWSRFVTRVRRKYKSFEFVRVWELHESGYPHLHVLQRGTFIPQKWLSATWNACGGGQVCDIRRVHNDKAAAAYITKYLGKGFARLATDFPNLRLVNKSRAWEREKPQQTKLRQNADMTWVRIKASYHQALSALAQCGAKLTNPSYLALVYDLDLSAFDPMNKAPARCPIPFSVFQDFERPPP